MKPELSQTHPTVVHMLVQAAERSPDRIALICQEDVLTYRDYLSCVTSLAAELQRLGIRPGDRVITILANSADAAIATFGVQAAGAQLVPLNPAYTAAELDPVLADADAKAILVDKALCERLAGVLPPVVPRIIVGAGARRLTVPLLGAVDLPDLASLHPGMLSTLQYTGGTTGLPKGASLSHRSVALNVAQREVLLPTDEGGQVMCITPLFHVYAVSMGLYLAANRASTLHIIRKFDAETVLSMIARERIAVLSASPTILLGLMEHESFSATDFSSLRVCSSGSAALPEAVLHRWEAATGCPVCEGYGQTEAGPVLTYNPLNGRRKPGTVGIAAPQTQIEIVDVETGSRPLSLGEVGEIRAKGPQIMSGYRNRPTETAEALRDGWLYTGDMGSLDADGYLTISDRKKDMVITAGFNVYPREIEEVLAKHPAIAEAAVVGVPDAYRGEALVAFVVPRHPDVAAGEIMTFLGERLTKYKWPREIRLAATLPKTAVGKINKVALRNMAVAPAVS